MKEFKVNDIVRCTVNYYTSVKRGERKRVRGIDQYGNLILTCRDSPVGTSTYHACNFVLEYRPTIEKAEEPMATEKTKYFAMLLDEKQTSRQFLVGKDAEMTVLRDTPNETEADIKLNLKEGERWVILKTIALIELEPPKPPIKITYYR